MKRPRSTRFQLSSVFFFFFLLVVVLGLFSISRLSDFNSVSSDIADHWLPNTRVLGDLNNFTSDFRAAEASGVLSTTTADVAASEREISELDHSIASAQRSYEQMRHDAAEAELYANFKARWSDYRRHVDQAFALARSNRKAEAVALYMTDSRTAYAGASDSLGQLTSRNVANAQAASSRAAEAYHDAVLLIAVAIGFAGMMVAAALIYISRRISSPLLHLADRMHRLASNDTDINIEGTERRDEIGEMARAAVVFRNNAIELMISQRGLAQQASMLEEKLAAERHLTLLQRNFVSMVSHEFRTPLTVIDGHAQRLIKMIGRLTPNEIVERAGRVRGAVLRLTHLIDNLLNAERLLDGGGLYFHPAEIDMVALLHDVCELHREIAPKSKIVEHFTVDVLPIVGDRNLLSQAFSNLLSNAVKYSPGGGLISISAAREDEHVVVTVEDRGIGIPAGNIDRLFERYYRGDNVSGVVGTGVGLYLVRIVVDLHGGGIAVESTEGEGSRFTVRLPITLQKQPEEVARPSAEPAY
jgi:two-component system OmpR family sensor kinase